MPAFLIYTISSLPRGQFPYSQVPRTVLRFGYLYLGKPHCLPVEYLQLEAATCLHLGALLYSAAHSLDAENATVRPGDTGGQDGSYPTPAAEMLLFTTTPPQAPPSNTELGQ